MASTIPFKLITPRRVVFEGAASLVIAVNLISTSIEATVEDT